MDSLKFAKTVVFVIWCLVGVSNGEVHKVGDIAGWTTIGHVDYTEWARNRTFRLGDQIVFEYNPDFHNVMQVTHAEYRACNASSPISTFTTGNDTITINNPGHHFYVCGVTGHCQSGQKVDINVPINAAVTTAPPPSAVSSPVPSITNSSSFAARQVNATVRKLFGWAALQLLLAFCFRG
ncbi:Cupredoxin superfamily protein [Striga hermonthica]|uniref:Cupredoxin superfamily protein n=1 Tax=Striga hermonthica TaxID=68872 RepID=A0A9N7MQ56_STRHE|nr:Cupredoxin superfamily protein [Striga hermonthica]